MSQNPEGSLADDIKGFFSSLFGSPSPAKRPPPAQPKQPQHVQATVSSPPIVKKNPKSLEDGWEIVATKVDTSKSPGNIPNDLKRRPREGTWNFREYITSEDYSQAIPDGPTYADAKENMSRFQYVYIEADKINLAHLRRCMWDTGCHKQVRYTSWKMSLGYLPLWTYLHEPVLAVRRARYNETVRSIGRLVAPDEEESQSVKQLIRSGLSNTALKIPIFRSSKLTKMLERIIQVWLLDNAEQPYVDTLALIPLPLTYAFLYEYGDVESMDVDRDLTDETVFHLEVDVYNCMSLLLLKGDAKQLLVGNRDRFLTRLAEIVRGVDSALAAHIEANVSYADFALAWFDTLLIDQFQKISLTVFLWDHYLANDSFVNYHIALCAFILVRFEAPIKKLRQQDLLQMLQSLPLHKWDYSNLEPLIDRLQEMACSGVTAPPTLDYAELKARALRRVRLGLGTPYGQNATPAQSSSVPSSSNEPSSPGDRISSSPQGRSSTLSPSSSSGKLSGSKGSPAAARK